MNSSLNTGKRALTTAIAAATMLWSVGFSSFVAPLTAHAASAGDLIKGQTLSTLYYYGNDGKRYAFPDEKTYFSWYSDFSGVQTISDSQLAAIPLGGNIMRRPGTFWVKIQSDPKTYAVTPNGVLRWIETESVATSLAGSNWNQFIQDVPDVFFADYTIGASLTSAASAYNGALVTDTTGASYVIQNGQKRPVTSAGFSANRLQSRFALTGTGINLSAITTDGTLSSNEASVSDAAQLPATVVGGLTVSLASDTPAAMTVPSGASSVTFLKFNLAAASATTVNSLVVNQSGIGATSNVSNVYLYDGSKRLTDGHSVNTSSRQVTFSALNLALAAGQTKELSLVVDMASSMTAGDTVAFQIAGATAISASVSATGTFPIQGNTMSTSATPVGTLTITKSGSITNPTLGAKQAEIGEFKLAAATEGVSVQRIRLNVVDATKHTNYNLYQNNILVAAGVPATSDSVDFTFTNPFDIAQGDNKIFQLKADIGGKNGDVIRVAIDQTSDVYGTGDKYGFGAKVTNTSYGSTTSTECAGTTTGTSTPFNYCSYSLVQGGKVTFAFNGPSTADFKKNQTGLNLMNLTVTSQNDVTVRSLAFTIAGTNLQGTTTTDANYQSFRLVDKATGNTISGPVDLASGFSNTTNTLTFPDDFSMTAGQSMDLQLLVDAKGSSSPYDIVTSDTIHATYLNASTSIRDVNNTDLTVGTDIIPGTDLPGNTMTAKLATLSIAASQPPGNGKYVKGSSNVPMLGVSFATSSASPVTVSAVTLHPKGEDAISGDVTANDLDPTTYISSCSIYDASSGALVAGPESFVDTKATSTWATAGTDSSVITFNGFNWTVPAGETKKLLAKCNFANVAPASSTDDGWALNVAAATDVTANDADGNSVAADTTVNTSGAVFQTITSAGSMTSSVDGSTPNSTIVLGNSTAVPVSTFKFQAATEDMQITDLSLGNCLTATYGCNGVLTVATSSTSTTNTVTVTVGSVTKTLTAGTGYTACATDSTPNEAACATLIAAGINADTTLSPVVHAVAAANVVTVTQVSGTGIMTLAKSGSDYTLTSNPAADLGSDSDLSAVNVSYQDSTGSTVTKSGSFSNGKLTFSGLDFLVPADTVKTLAVSVTTNPVTSTPALSGTQFAINFIPSDFKANGQSSGTTLTYANVTQALGNTMTVRKTKPTITLASGSPSGAGIPGLAEVYRFNVSADSRGFVTLNQILFKVTSTDIAVSSWNKTTNSVSAIIAAADGHAWNIYDSSNPSTALTGTFYPLGADGLTIGSNAIGFAKLVFTTGQQIGAGSTKTYSLKVDTTGASASQNDSIRIDIPSQADGTGMTGSNAARNVLLWSDDVVALSTATADATTGEKTSPPANSDPTKNDGTQLNGALIKNLPVTGGTIAY